MVIVVSLWCVLPLRGKLQNGAHFYMMAVGSGFIDAGRKGGVARFINHSCEPNAEAQIWDIAGERRVGIFALKDVPAGTEVTFDYKWERKGFLPIICRCGAPSCRGFLGGRGEGGQGVPAGRFHKPSFSELALAATPAPEGSRSGIVGRWLEVFLRRSVHLSRVRAAMTLAGIEDDSSLRPAERSRVLTSPEISSFGGGPFPEESGWYAGKVLQAVQVSAAQATYSGWHAFPALDATDSAPASAMDGPIVLHLVEYRHEDGWRFRRWDRLLLDRDGDEPESLSSLRASLGTAGATNLWHLLQEFMSVDDVREDDVVSVWTDPDVSDAEGDEIAHAKKDPLMQALLLRQELKSSSAHATAATAPSSTAEDGQLRFSEDASALAKRLLDEARVAASEQEAELSRLAETEAERAREALAKARSAAAERTRLALEAGGSEALRRDAEIREEEARLRAAAEEASRLAANRAARVARWKERHSRKREKRAAKRERQHARDEHKAERRALKYQRRKQEAQRRARDALGVSRLVRPFQLASVPLAGWSSSSRVSRSEVVQQLRSVFDEDVPVAQVLSVLEGGALTDPVCGRLFPFFHCWRNPEAAIHPTSAASLPLLIRACAQHGASPSLALRACLLCLRAASAPFPESIRESLFSDEQVLARDALLTAFWSTAVAPSPLAPSLAGTVLSPASVAAIDSFAPPSRSSTQPDGLFLALGGEVSPVDPVVLIASLTRSVVRAESDETLLPRALDVSRSLLDDASLSECPADWVLTQLKDCANNARALRKLSEAVELARSATGTSPDAAAAMKQLGKLLRDDASGVPASLSALRENGLLGFPCASEPASVEEAAATLLHASGTVSLGAGGAAGTTLEKLAQNSASLCVASVALNDLLSVMASSPAVVACSPLEALCAALVYRAASRLGIESSAVRLPVQANLRLDAGAHHPPGIIPSTDLDTAVRSDGQTDQTLCTHDVASALSALSSDAALVSSVTADGIVSSSAPESLSPLASPLPVSVTDSRSALRELTPDSDSPSLSLGPFSVALSVSVLDEDEDAEDDDEGLHTAKRVKRSVSAAPPCWEHQPVIVAHGPWWRSPGLLQLWLLRLAHSPAAPPPRTELAAFRSALLDDLRVSLEATEDAASLLSQLVPEPTPDILSAEQSLAARAAKAFTASPTTPLEDPRPGLLRDATSLGDAAVRAQGCGISLFVSRHPFLLLPKEIALLQSSEPSTGILCEETAHDLAGLLLSGLSLGATHAQRIAAETTKGLRRLHERGLAHRRLSPACVHLTHQGSVRLADLSGAKWAPVSSWKRSISAIRGAGTPVGKCLLSVISFPESAVDRADRVLSKLDSPIPSPLAQVVSLDAPLEEAVNASRAALVLSCAPPEALLGGGGAAWGPAGDCWALGCVLAHLFLGQPLFQGTTVLSVLEAQVALFGPLDSKWEAIVHLPSWSSLLPSLNAIAPDSGPRSVRASLAALGMNEHQAALVADLLKVDPSERLSARAASEHAFFKSYRPPAEVRTRLIGKEARVAAGLPANPVDDFEVMNGALAPQSAVPLSLLEEAARDQPPSVRALLNDPFPKLTPLRLASIISSRAMSLSS
jgi:serine/threonine protein kinase